MKILAISGSPRKNRMTQGAIQEILANCTSDYEVISLANKKINGCIACTACAKDNICKVKDDWTDIGKKMQHADVIIFGAPNYFGMVNALAHATLERTFSFRHRSSYTLKDKLGLIVTTCEKKEDKDPVAAYIEKMFTYNQIQCIGKMQVYQYNQCYTCGFGHDCNEGSVVRKHGILEKILPCHLPQEVSEQTETLAEIKRIKGLLTQHGVTYNECE